LAAEAGREGTGWEAARSNARGPGAYATCRVARRGGMLAAVGYRRVLLRSGRGRRGGQLQVDLQGRVGAGAADLREGDG
jgi:hypothetical protein